MLSSLIPNMSRHFLYSVLEHDVESGIEIIKTITRFPPEMAGDFLLSLGGALDGIFCRLEIELEGFSKVMDEAIEALKNPIDDDMEELN